MFTDSITSLDLQVLYLESNNEVAAEVGPLRYMSEITGKPMGVIVNWFTLLIVFVFDPLAISMVIALNKLTKKDENRRSGNGSGVSDSNHLNALGDDATYGQDGKEVPIPANEVGNERDKSIKETPKEDIIEIYEAWSGK